MQKHLRSQAEGLKKQAQQILHSSKGKMLPSGRQWLHQGGKANCCDCSILLGRSTARRGLSTRAATSGAAAWESRAQQEHLYQGLLGERQWPTNPHTWVCASPSSAHPGPPQNLAGGPQFTGKLKLEQLFLWQEAPGAASSHSSALLALCSLLHTRPKGTQPWRRAVPYGRNHRLLHPRGQLVSKALYLIIEDAN